MRVLVACEFSGVVRDAFLALGHDAVSCDLLSTESPGPHHQGDVRDILGDGWELLIAHPPCTYLTNSGVRWLYDHERYPNRWKDMVDGAVFFRDLLDAPVAHVAVENPTMHNWAARIVGRRATQTVQPWMFGHEESKATGLWLRGLPPLISTEDVLASMLTRPKPEWARTHWAPNSKGRSHRRSVTYTGIAHAMATQWSAFLEDGVAA